MNCEPGDIAQVVRLRNPNGDGHVPSGLLGAVVTIQKVAPVVVEGSYVWPIEERIPVTLNAFEALCMGFQFGDTIVTVGLADWALKPLRYKEGQDESLSWKSSPQPHA